MLVFTQNAESRDNVATCFRCEYFQVGIPHFGDRSKCRMNHKQLKTMSVGELQLIVNDFLSQIEGTWRVQNSVTQNYFATV